MKLPNNVAETVDFVEKLVFDGAVLNDKELLDLIELALQGGKENAYANAIISFMENPDKQGAWDRFVVTSVRTFGPNWRQEIKRVSGLKLDQLHVFACSTKGCMELAWGRECDHCMARRWGRP